ncbi:CU044_5270 family protein [Actinoallomurus sp. NPDC052308]|uniref:CU044_5270 family protein n=1 Tax=Actinoallomurus sp. NPDC052308 TaxID=3155530 RepID=UPI003442ABF1
MNPGATLNRDPDDLFRTLKPVGLETMAAEAHSRRRERDLAEAWGGGDSGRAVSMPTARRRRPRLLVAGLAAGAVAASAALVIVATDGSGGSPGVRPTASHTVRALDARAILLTSADSAAKAPATTGAYWYTRERETSIFSTSDFRKAAQKRIARQLGEKSLRFAPFTAYVSKTQDSWYGRDRRDRTITGIDPRITFPSPADEAAWKKLTPKEKDWFGVDPSGKPHVNNYDFSGLKPNITQRDKTIEALTRLPTDPAGLQKTMRTWFKHENQLSNQHDGEPMGDSFAQYVFGEAQDLLAGPLTPGAKAALYRLLAEQPGIRYLGTADDPMGRKGAVLALGGNDARPGKGFEIRLIIDPQSGRLLAQESGDRKAPSLTMTYEAMGWVNRLGARP